MCKMQIDHVCRACGQEHDYEPWEHPECWEPWQEYLATVNRRWTVGPHTGSSTVGRRVQCRQCAGDYYVLWATSRNLYRNVCGPCKLARKRRENLSYMRRLRAEQRPEPEPCARCGESFTPPRSDARYCSPACRQAAYRERKVASTADG
jgi:hypothetical protein